MADNIDTTTHTQLPAIRARKPAYSHAFLEIAASNKKLTRLKKSQFLDHLAECGNQAVAAARVGVHPKTILSAIKTDPEFADAASMAKEAFSGFVEQELIRRAMKGIDDFKLDNKGNIVLRFKKYSDKLLEMLVKKNLPEYNDKTALDVNVKGGLLVLNSTMDQTQWNQKFGHKGSVEIEAEIVTNRSDSGKCGKP